MTTETTTLEPGIHLDVPAEQYHAMPLFSYSTAKVLAGECPAMARWRMEHPHEQTDPQRFGELIHVAIFEGEAGVMDRYAVGPDAARNTKVWKEWAAEQDDRPQIKAAEFVDAMEIADAVRLDKWLGPLMTGKGKNEVTIVEDMPITTHDHEKAVVRVKGRLDRLTVADGYGCVVDVKSAAAIGRSDFEGAATRYQYHWQAGAYLHLLNLEDLRAGREPKRRRYIFVCVRNSPPYLVAGYELEEDAIRAGLRQFRDAARTWHHCVTLDAWPGYTEWNGGIETCSVRPWAL